jgi:hypothetical protein
MKKILYLLLCTIGIMTISCDNEQPSAPYIRLSHNTIEAWYDTETYIVDVYANCKWKATSNSDWVTIQKGENSQSDGIIKFEIKKNESAEFRTAQITVEAVGYTDIFETITISQSVLSDDYFKICYTSTDNKVVESYLSEAFDAEIVSNTYENGIGTILFDKPITKVGDEAFCDCSTLKSITLPDGVTELGGWAFFGCFYIEEATLSNRLKTIGDAAFSSCSTLSSITLPQSLEYVGDSAFYGCSGMSGYYGKFASVDNRCLVIDNTLRHFAPKGLTKYEIADGITAIAHDAFYESLRLQSVTIPQSVTSIGEYAFYYCENLKSVYCKRPTPPDLGASAFDNSDNGMDKPIGCKIFVPTSAVDLYKWAENWKRYKSYIYGDDTL